MGQFVMDEEEKKKSKGQYFLLEFIKKYEKEWPELIFSIRYKTLYQIEEMLSDKAKAQFYNYFSINSYTSLKNNINGVIMCLLPFFSYDLQLPGDLKTYVRYYDCLTQFYKESSNTDTTLQNYIFDILTYEVFPFYVKIMENPIIEQFFMDKSARNYSKYHYQHFISFIKKDSSFLNHIHLLKLPHKVRAFTNRYLQIIINIQDMDNYGTDFLKKKTVWFYLIL